jgi:hypothetical protein
MRHAETNTRMISRFMAVTMPPKINNTLVDILNT